MNFLTQSARAAWRRLTHARPICLAGLSLLLLGCQVGAQTGRDAATIIGRGVVNSPSNKSLRFDMLKFGLNEFCNELMLRGAPLRLADGQPVIGRYFGDSCQAKSIDTLEKRTVIVQFDGRGYAWTAATGRIGFRARGLLELAPDFRVYKEAMYVYFRPVQVDTSDFELLMAEKPLAQAAAALAGLSEKEVGQSIINAQLGRGFTAIRYDIDGHTDFALGLVDQGDTPFRPYSVLASPRTTAANGRTEMFRGQQDYVGKIRVKKGEEVTLTLNLEGTEAVDFALVTAKTAEPHLQAYLRTPGTQKVASVPTFLSQATDTAKTRARIKVPPGDYFLVLDHSAAWGTETPAEGALPARVDYLIQTGAPQK